MSALDNALLEFISKKDEVDPYLNGEYEASNLLVKLLENTRYILIHDEDIWNNLLSCVNGNVIKLFSFGNKIKLYDANRATLFKEAINSLTTDKSKYIIRALINANLYGKIDRSIDMECGKWELQAKVTGFNVLVQLRRKISFMNETQFCEKCRLYLREIEQAQLKDKKMEIADKLFEYLSNNELPINGSEKRIKLYEVIHSKVIELEDQMKEYYETKVNSIEKLEMFERLKNRSGEIAESSTSAYFFYV